MDTLTRRRFLIASGVTGGAALAAAAGTVTWQQLHQRATTSPLASGSRILVIVTLYGGNDGLNTVIPYADGAYHSARPDLAYADTEVLHLDSALGLNPAMTGLAKLWSANQLAIVRGVGYPKPDHSHFRSMDIWQTASPDQPINTGWIGRWLDATGDDPVRAVNLGSTLPPLVVGAHSAAASLDVGKYSPLPADLAAALTGLAASSPGDTDPEQLVRESYSAERKVAATFASVLDPNAATASPDNQTAASSAGGQNNLKGQLDVVSRCIKAGVPTRVYSVSLGGFDTHADEKASQQAQLGVLDLAVSQFLAGLAGDPYGRNVVLLAYSEFGRRVAANGSQGTDHGTAGPVFVAGVPVKGGFYGDQPSLTNLDNGDLKVSTDFRSIYAELVQSVLGADPGRIITAAPKPLGLLV
jgi:uncharacterized protein (DUF1501 family)